MRCPECGQEEYVEDSGGCQVCGAGVLGELYPQSLPMRGLGSLLTGLLTLTTEVIAAQLMLRAYGAASGQPWASRLSSRLADAGEAAFVLTAIVFVVWFRRARINAENSSWWQRRARGWTFWGWIIPIANLFVPFQLMGDIWRARLPAARRRKTAWLPALWWTAWLLSGIYVSSRSSQSGGAQYPSLSLRDASSFNLCAAAISGALVIPIVRAVSAGPVRGVPAAWNGDPAQPRTRRKTPPSVMAVLLAAVVAMAGSAAAVGLIGISTYRDDTVHLPAGKTVLVVLSPGIYRVFAGCANDTGCPQLRAAALSVQGTLTTPPGLVSDNEHEKLIEAGQPFIGEFIFGVPAQEPMRFTLHTSLGQPGFIAPSDDRLLGLRGWIAVAAISGMVLFGLPTALALLLTRRDADGAA